MRLFRRKNMASEELRKRSEELARRIKDIDPRLVASVKCQRCGNDVYLSDPLPKKCPHCGKKDWFD